MTDTEYCLVQQVYIIMQIIVYTDNKSIFEYTYMYVLSFCKQEHNDYYIGKSDCFYI